MGLSKSPSFSPSGNGGAVTMPGMGSFQGMIQDVSAANNAWNAEQAEKQMDFNSSEASKNREWQKMMSDSAHQREVKDLIAAGLNPILAVNGGQGAPVGSGATAASGSAAKADNSNVAALTSVLNGMLQRKTQMEMADMSAKTNLAVAEKYNAMSKYVAELQRKTGLDLEHIRGAFSKDIAGINANASMHNADVMAGAQIQSATIAQQTAQQRMEVDKWIAQQHNLTESEKARLSAETARYAADVNAAAQRYASDQSASNKRELQEAQQEYDKYIHEHFPSNVWQAAGGLENGLLNSLGLPDPFKPYGGMTGYGSFPWPMDGSHGSFGKY